MRALSSLPGVGIAVHDEDERSIEGALAVRAQAGDAHAFRALFERHAPSVRRFLIDLLRNTETADEATQETFVRAHARLSTLRDADKVTAWLFGIARHVFREQIRVRKHESTEQRGYDEMDSAPTPEAALMGREADTMLATAMAALSEERRTALLLRLDHGLEYEEIAEIMGWSLAKVKNEIHRGRLKLRESLKHYLGEGV